MGDVLQLERVLVSEAELPQAVSRNPLVVNRPPLVVERTPLVVERTPLVVERGRWSCSAVTGLEAHAVSLEARSLI